MQNTKKKKDNEWQDPDGKTKSRKISASSRRTRSAGDHEEEGGEDESSDGSDEGDTGGSENEFTLKNVRRLINRIKMYGTIARVDDIVASAKLSKPKDIVAKAVTSIITSSKELAYSKPNNKRVTFKFHGVTVNATALTQRIDDIEDLIKAMKAVGDHNYVLPVAVQPWTQFKKSNWNSPRDDAMLLVGVVTHGYGNWEKIRNDNSLGLKTKLGGPGAGAGLPTGSQTSQRVEALLKAIRDEKTPEHPPVKARGRKSQPKDDYSDEEDEYPRKGRITHSNNKLSVRIATSRKTKQDSYEEESDESPMEAEVDEEEALVRKCTELLSPLNVGMNNLKRELKATSDTTAKLNLNKQWIVSIGDLVDRLIQQEIDEDPKVFARCLWELAAKNYTRKTSEEIQRFYKSLKGKHG